MNISLTPELENFIQEKLNSGMYTSVSEVIRESLRLMADKDKHQLLQVRELNRAIDFGLQQLARGEIVSSQESYQKMKKKLKTLAEKKND